MKRHQASLKVLSYLFLGASSFIMLYPVLFMALGAFTTQDRSLEAVLLPIPNTLNLELFLSAWNAGVKEAYLFTFVRCAFYVAISLGVGLIGGYIFSKMRFPGRTKVFVLFLSGMVMPGILMYVPIFTIIFWVYGPLLKPSLIALVIITFLNVWNDYLWPSLTVSSYPDFIPMTMRIQGVGLSSSSAVGGPFYPGAMIRTLLAMWPPAAVYFLLQRYLIHGLVASGLRG